MNHSAPLLLTCSLFATACASTAPRAAAPAGPEQEAPAHLNSAGHVGVVVPGGFTAVSIWPEAYKGEMLVLEVVAQGTAVAAGDTLLELDTRAIDEQLADAELDLASATVKHEGLLERNRVAAEAAEAQLTRARAGVDRARRSLEGYENFEVDFARRIDKLSEQREKARVDDQIDELGQLEAMYNADELTDSTEEIVLKREQRNLDLLRESTLLSADRRTYDEEFDRSMEAERRREAVQQKELELAHLVRTQATEKAARDDGETRSAADLEKKKLRLERLRRDRELFTVVAPHAGTVLHGKEADYRPGKSAQRLRRASNVSARADFMMVVQPGKLAVALDIAESDLGTLSDGTRVTLSPVAGGGESVEGQLSVAAYPSGQKGNEATHAGRVELPGAAVNWIPGMHVKVAAVAAEAEESAE